LESAATEAGLPISLTGCQGPCKQAPVLSLRIAERSEFFAQIASARDWQAILEFARQARTAGTLMTNAGSAEPFRFDPVHDHLKPSVHLTQLQFLLGQFLRPGEIYDDTLYFILSTKKSSAHRKQAVVSSLCAWASPIRWSTAEQTSTMLW
jgi:hypothetical protein